MKFSASLVSATATALFSARAAADDLSISSESDIKSTAKTVANDLLSYYKGDEKGQIPGILPGPPPAGDYYWWTGSAMWAALVEYWHYTGDSAHNDAVMKGMLFQVGPQDNFMPTNWTVSMGNDDQGFWGIAAMTAAERNFPNPPRDQPQWLGLAQNVFQDLAGRWDSNTCDGGLRWQIAFANNGYNYKNSISAGVLMNLGARLQRYTGNSTFGDWADKSWTWAEDAGLIDDGAIYDGAHVEKNCTDRSKVEFSYNSGVYVLGAAHMYNATGDSKWKNRLDTVLKHSMKQFFKDGVVYESACETADTCTSDMTFFKGIFVQMLASAAQVAPYIASDVMPALKKSAAAAVKSCSGKDDACSFKWIEGSKPDDDDDDDDASVPAKGHFDADTSAGTPCNVLSSVSGLLAGSADAPYTAKSGGTSSGGSSGNSTRTGDSTNTGGDGNGNSTKGSGNNGKNGKGDGGDKKGAATKMGGSVVFRLAMAGAAVLLL